MAAPVEPTREAPTPFADAMKQWATTLLGAWADVLAAQFDDGMTSVDALVKATLQAKLMAVGPELAMFLPMISGVLSSVVVRAHQQYQATQLSASSEWLQHVPPEERRFWADTIAADEKRQLEMQARAQQIGRAHV